MLTDARRLVNKMRKIYTILDGEKLAGDREKAVISPYSLNQVANINYAKLEKIERKRAKKHDMAYLRRILQDFADYLSSESIKLARVAAEETGSPIKYHKKDIEAVIEYIEHLCDGFVFQESPYVHESKGKVLILLSANEPVVLGTIPLLTALMTGNTVYLKPSSRSPSYAYLIVNKLHKLGLESDLLHLLLPEKQDIETIIQRQTVDCVLSFGHHKTNRILGAIAAKAGVEFIPENDGNCWAYVDEDFPFCNKKLISTIKRSVVKHNGQMCDSLRGLLIHNEVFDDISKGIIENIKDVNMGNPLDVSSDVGALLVGTASKIPDLIEESSGKTYKYHVENNVVSPTVVLGPRAESTLVEDSVFAPVLWIKSVSGPQEVIELYKRHNHHGLCFSIFSNDESSIEKLSRNISVGRINVNCSPVEIDVMSPWGGLKTSGYGGPTSWFDRFTNRKVINHGQF